jgi:hypothetical protein
MFARLGAIAFAARSKTKRDILEDPELMKILSTKAQFYKFRTFPMSLWIYGVINLIVAVLLNYYLFVVIKKGEGEGLFILYFVMFLFYLVGFVVIYAGKMETVIIDKKKGIIRKTLINCFLSKIEYVKSIDNLGKIEMVKKGHIRNNSDSTRYYIRYTFKDKFIMEWGETYSFYEIQKKYRISKAILQGEVIVEEAKIYLVKDETVDYTSYYNSF